MQTLINSKKLEQIDNIGTYEADLKIIVKKIVAEDEIKANLYMDKLLNNKDYRKIYDIIDDKNVLYVYLDPQENIDDLFIEEDEDIIKQANFGGPPPLTLSYIEEIFELEKAMCKIEFQINENGKITTGIGTGCFIQLNPEDFIIKRILLTNHHVLDETKIKGSKEIDIIYKGEIKKINLLKRRIYTSENLDYTCIEIFEEDNIDLFFNIDQRIFENDTKLFKKEEIFILHYPLEGDLNFSIGKILSISNSNISHNCKIIGDSLGSPIISRYNSSLIGLYFGEPNNNMGKEISCILNDIKSKIQNFIVAEFEINEENINKNIRIINSFEQSILEKGKNIKEEAYKNEKTIKDNCRIEINNSPIPFTYYYKFPEKGKYSIKYSFISRINDINRLFLNCNSLKSVDLSNFNCENVTNLSCIFRNCINLEKITFKNYASSFNTLNVTDMSSMFENCQRLKDLNLLYLNTSKVTNMSYMFYHCFLLDDLDFSKFNTEKVTNMSWMFFGCESLQKLLLNNFNTENVTDMSYMFCGCKSLTKFNLSSFNTEKVRNMKQMFGNCSLIRYIDLPNFKTNNIENMMDMFCGCYSLRNLDIINFSTENIPNIKKITNMFLYCQNLLLNCIKVTDKNIIDEYNREDREESKKNKAP